MKFKLNDPVLIYSNDRDIDRYRGARGTVINRDDGFPVLYHVLIDHSIYGKVKEWFTSNQLFPSFPIGSRVEITNKHSSHCKSDELNGVRGSIVESENRHYVVRFDHSIDGLVECWFMDFELKSLEKDV